MNVGQANFADTAQTLVDYRGNVPEAVGKRGRMYVLANTRSPEPQLQLTSISMSRHAQPAPVCAQPAHEPTRRYVSQPLLSDECPPTCSTGSQALTDCALLYDNDVRPNVTFCRSYIRCVCVCVRAGCSKGRYGPNCSLQCDCENGATCDEVSGRCRCRLGWIGPRCTDPHRQYRYTHSLSLSVSLSLSLVVGRVDKLKFHGTDTDTVFRDAPIV